MAPFRKIVEELTGESDLVQAEREVLKSLDDLAKSKADYFEQQVQLSLFTAGDGKIDKTLPVSVVTRMYRQTRCYSSNDASKITDEVKTSIKNFIGGDTNDIVDGVFGLLSTAVSAFLGESSSANDEMYEYFVYATPFGIYRVDCYAWYQTVTASSVKTKVEKATAYSYTHSVVDISSINWRDFVAIYGVQLYNESLTAQQIEQARNEIRLTWQYLLSDPARSGSSFSSGDDRFMTGSASSGHSTTSNTIPTTSNAIPSRMLGSGRGPLARSRELVENLRISRLGNGRRSSLQSVRPLPSGQGEPSESDEKS